jgi:hypothetical protein
MGVIFIWLTLIHLISMYCDSNKQNVKFFQKELEFDSFLTVKSTDESLQKRLPIKLFDDEAYKDTLISLRIEAFQICYIQYNKNIKEICSNDTSRTAKEYDSSDEIGLILLIEDLDLLRNIDIYQKNEGDEMKAKTFKYKAIIYNMDSYEITLVSQNLQRPIFEIKGETFIFLKSLLINNNFGNSHLQITYDNSLSLLSINFVNNSKLMILFFSIIILTWWQIISLVNKNKYLLNMYRVLTALLYVKICINLLIYFYVHFIIHCNNDYSAQSPENELMPNILLTSSVMVGSFYKTLLWIFLLIFSKVNN